MKNLYFVSMILFLFSFYQANAKIWRVNNQPGIDADFTTLQLAHDSLNSGDTIHLESSTLGYGALVANKKVIVIGNGYFNGQNPETQAILPTSKITTITFLAGSEGSVVMGCEISGKTYFRTSNICIMRNYIQSNFNMGVPNLPANLNNILIKQNYITWNSYSISELISTDGNLTMNNLVIKNNIIIQTHNQYGFLNLNGNYSGIFENNVIANTNPNSGVSLNYFVVRNNIFASGTFNGNSTCTVSYNIGNLIQFPNMDGNLQNINMTSVFEGSATNSSDGYYKLKAGSPAIGAGENGVNCGAIGGSDPYVLSGLPSVPAIYFFSISGSGSQATVKLKIKSHN